MFPKTGKKLPPSGEELAFAAMMSEALVGHLGQTHQAVKIVMRWTGASERSVKHWLAGVHAPRGMHLLGLMRNSDEVLRRLLIASGRGDVLVALEVSALRERLIETLAFIDKFFPSPVGRT
ncbi:hypothetical protein EWH08_19650 [Sphingobium indicum]|uniref:XRE family transcriptional regulator n=2 Tax=Sphingobium indicum TaxID=332055 RepID=A0A1L5BRU6_SPHIB|nr:hypothetical protein [Sphingobium indicum]APL95579.1 hypothetical protein SIDU_14240 [Sphingobium indicum B90A]KEZ00670.1 hypothetical protein AI27_03125 [Sphingomonas sp. BHC-A]NYI25009.1 hypothetical protein [Sphingobium indicum]RYL96490.1 hypothetical protein EWH08_19650 [Sphingobium indicum]